MKKYLMTKEILINAYTQYLEKEFGKEFYNDIGSLVTAKDDAELWVNEALRDNFIADYDINSLYEFVKVMGIIYTDGYLSIEDYNEIIEEAGRKGEIKTTYQVEVIKVPVKNHEHGQLAKDLLNTFFEQTANKTILCTSDNVEEAKRVLQNYKLDFSAPVAEVAYIVEIETDGCGEEFWTGNMVDCRFADEEIEFCFRNDDDKFLSEDWTKKSIVTTDNYDKVFRIVGMVQHAKDIVKQLEQNDDSSWFYEIY